MPTPRQADAVLLRQAAIAAAGDSVVIFDRQMRIQSLRGEGPKRHGYRPEHVVGRHASEVLSEWSWQRLKVFYARALAGETVTIDWEPEQLDSVYETTFAPVYRGDEIIGGVIAARDVTERRHLNRELDAARHMLEAIFDSAPLGKFISRLCPDGRFEIVQCNPAFARLLGRSQAEVVGRAALEFVHPEDHPLRDRLIALVLASGNATVEARWIHSDGRAIWTQTSASASTGPDGEPLYILQCADLSERVELEERLRYVADHDALTGLYSRRRFDRELRREMRRNRQHDSHTALLLLDLDGFKVVNDSRGHGAGDQLLSDIAANLRDAVCEHDVLARIGGDEFAAILPDTSTDAARATAERLLGAICRHPFGQISGSVGVAQLDEEAVRTSGQFLAQADGAMYRAKAAGHNHICVSGDEPYPVG